MAAPPPTPAPFPPFDPSDWPAWAVRWYGFLVGVTALNLFVLWPCARAATARNPSSSPQTRAYRALQRGLATPFVLICAYRAVFPTTYQDRIVLLDTPLSNALGIRLLSIVAELAALAQLSNAVARVAADLQRELDAVSPRSAPRATSRTAWAVSVAARAPVGCIACAEVVSTLGTATTDAMWFMLEEGAWCFGFSVFFLPCTVYLCAAAAELVWRRWGRAGPRLGPALFFVAFFTYYVWSYSYNGVTSDVPSYYEKWQRQLAAHARFLPVRAGLLDAATTRRPSRSYDVWEPYFSWLTPYFSVSVWISIYMMSAPRIDDDEGPPPPGKDVPLVEV